MASLGLCCYSHLLDVPVVCLFDRFFVTFSRVFNLWFCCRNQHS